MSRKQFLYTMHPTEAGKRYFGKGRDWSRQAAKTGALPSIKIGNSYFVSVPALEAMIANAGKIKEPEGST